MEARIKTLEEKERRLEPLIQVGVDIRCRAFEKYHKDKDPTAEEDLVLVKRGNSELFPKRQDLSSGFMSNFIPSTSTTLTPLKMLHTMATLLQTLPCSGLRL
jgi:hypothetical protein